MAFSLQECVRLSRTGPVSFARYEREKSPRATSPTTLRRKLGLATWAQVLEVAGVPFEAQTSHAGQRVIASSPVLDTLARRFTFAPSVQSMVRRARGKHHSDKVSKWQTRGTCAEEHAVEMLRYFRFSPEEIALTLRRARALRRKQVQAGRG